MRAPKRSTVAAIFSCAPAGMKSALSHRIVGPVRRAGPEAKFERVAGPIGGVLAIRRQVPTGAALGPHGVPQALLQPRIEPVLYVLLDRDAARAFAQPPQTGDHVAD